MQRKANEKRVRKASTDELRKEYDAALIRSGVRGKYLAHKRVASKMSAVKFVYWKGRKAWLGYLQDYPDYWTQGKTLTDLKEHLRDLYRDITSGEIPGIRKVEELIVS